MKVLGTVRNIFTIFAGAAMYHEKVRPGSSPPPRSLSRPRLLTHVPHVLSAITVRPPPPPHLNSPTCARQVSLNEWLGYSVALAGFAAYNAAKSGYFDGTPGAGGSGGSGGGGGGSGGAVLGLGLGQGGGVGTITPTSSYTALKVRVRACFVCYCRCAVASHLPCNHSQPITLTLTWC